MATPVHMVVKAIGVDVDGNPTGSSTAPSFVDLRRGLTVKFAKIVATASGATAVVAAVTAKKIKVLGYVFVAAGAVAVKFQSATTDITGVMTIGSNGGVAASAVAPAGGHLLETAAGEALNINLSDAVVVGGHLSYVEEA